MSQVASSNNTQGGRGPSPAALLAVDGLTVRYGGPDGAIAVDDVSFSVGRGERVALVGESGSGKTTLGLATAGFLTQSGVSLAARSMTFDGRPLDHAHGHRLPRRTPGISMVFQDAMTSLDPVWTIGSQLDAVLRSGQKMSARAAAIEAEHWLTRVGLHDTARVMGARPYELSGGMRQRVMMALALCGKPRLVIADEPTSALDASVSRATMDLMLELTTEFETSLLIVSHDIELCMEYSDRTLVMYKGNIVEQGPSSTLAETATHPYAVGLLACIPTLASRSRTALPTLADYMDRRTGAAVPASAVDAVRNVA
jgi:peptide/nickel transport system ATP-binding protein